MNFEFINNNVAVDGAVRKQIRCHVAKGRNLGKKLSQPSRKKAYGKLSKTQLQVTEPLVQSPTDTALSVHLPTAGKTRCHYMYSLSNISSRENLSCLFPISPSYRALASTLLLAFLGTTRLLP